MHTSSEKIDLHRRHLVGAAAVLAAATQLGMFVLRSSIAPVHAQAPSQQEQKSDHCCPVEGGKHGVEAPVP